MDKDKSLVWDCGSSLYDSFELNSFMQQLDSAITSRCMSMPHLSSDLAPPAPAPAQSRKKHSKLSKSVQKLLRSVLFGVKSMLKVQVQSHERKEQAVLHGAYSRSGRLASIPEVSNKEAASPEIDATVRKTMSERFTSATAAAAPAVIS